jgi:hypothetical protein
VRITPFYCAISPKYATIFSLSKLLYSNIGAYTLSGGFWGSEPSLVIDKIYLPLVKR